LGTKAAALMYWPRVGESLDLLVLLLERLEREIEDALGDEGRWVTRSLLACMWFRSATARGVVVQKPNSRGKNVGFAKEVRVRNVEGEEGEMGCRDGVAALTSDRKRTAGTFRFKAGEGCVKGSGDDCEESGEEVESE
jgi:hypothetical protein